jgi:hypothetical protein
MCDVARRYTLPDIHAFIQKNADSIGSWLPAAVHESISDLEKVVTESVSATRPYRPHPARRQPAPTWQNKNWNNFRSFKPTKVLSSETPMSRFRMIFNKLTESSVADTVAGLATILNEPGLEDVEATLAANNELAEVVLKGTVASPGNADLYARFLLACRSADAPTGALAVCVIDQLRQLCVKRSSKSVKPKDDSYDALCVANAENDTTTAYLRLAVLSERVGVLSAGSTGLLMKKLATRLSRLGTVAEDKAEAEVLVARLIGALEALGGKPTTEVKEAIDATMENCAKRSEYPGLGNKVRFTLMDYYDTLEE